MKGIFAITMLMMAAAMASAQEPATVPKPVQSPTTTFEKKDAPVKPEPATHAVEKTETVSKIEESIGTCDLTTRHSPVVSGLQLRMPEGEASAKAHTPFEKDPADPERRKRLTVKLDKDPILENLDSASITSYDQKVNYIKVTYPQKWPTVKEFIKEFAPKLGVSRIGFRVDREKNEALMVCKDFTLELKTGPTGSELTLTDKSGAM
jgi:hypothetical protein